MCGCYGELLEFTGLCKQIFEIRFYHMGDDTVKLIKRKLEQRITIHKLKIPQNIFNTELQKLIRKGRILFVASTAS